MTIPQKLKIIQRISGLTQEKLAAKIGVSFVALNRWIKSRAVPRQKAEQKIDQLYKEYTGQKEIPADILSAKKALILKKVKKIPNIIKKIITATDIYQEFQLALTYHSNRIEGSSLTEGQTARILFDNASFPNKSLIEHLEAKNHQAALQFLFNYLQQKKPIDETFILKLHGILLNAINHEAGFYRRAGVRITVANVPTANYLKIPLLMKKLVKDIQKSQKDIIAQAAEIHSRFEKIHPFADGNGRTGRLLLVAMLLENNLAPAIIRQEDKSLYLQYLNKSQSQSDFSLLENFLCEAILLGVEILEGK